MYDPLRSQSDIPLDRLRRQRHTLLLSRWLFIEDVTISVLGILGLGPGKDVESLLLVRRAVQCRIACALVLQQRIRRRGHRQGCQALFGGCTLVEGKIEPSCGFRHAEHARDAVGHRVDDCG